MLCKDALLQSGWAVALHRCRACSPPAAPCPAPVHAGSSPQSLCKDKSSSLGKQQQPQCSQQEAPNMSTVDAGVQGSLGSSSSSRPVKLAEPPFSADLSLPLGSNRQLLSSSCKPRRRRLPRLSVEVRLLQDQGALGGQGSSQQACRRILQQLEVQL